ncbi:hypothetical protein DYB28_000193 [Aphanomyces astaci]|uniref:Alpha-soluble NSF attachment protein n=3 Tax=Aphanomyces astaci TaxID=112090 RepID=A0A397DIF8_APHAT|nr:hypothetical protein DYB36_005753 [Aphanomyces astaci]RHY37329.1 hypothetical protein DYB34_002698 [Aphanomyces astaci]RHY61308.1 hypothetical protein DYB30_002957 [Aphanomyces astaci]RHY62657.1 hypothetical protein DYB38_002541 [Aphanomyces astaci]RHY93913.1 hypothetical protein DYB26_006251 [Aphanomyces astaci]
MPELVKTYDYMHDPAPVDYLVVLCVRAHCRIAPFADANSMAAHAEIKAEEFFRAGEKALTKFSLFSSSSKYEDASDYFEKAANQYKIAKKCTESQHTSVVSHDTLLFPGQESGEAFAKCADCQMRMKENSRAAQYYQQAAEAISKANPIGNDTPASPVCSICCVHVFHAHVDAVTYYRTAISMQCDAGRFSNAAKLQKQIAEIYEQAGQMQEALENYSQAADYFIGENQPSSAQPMLLKVAQFSAELERYPAAIEIYEKVAKTSMESNLLKYNAKSHLLNAGICAMSSKDIVLVKQKIDEFNDIDYTFPDSREGKFLTAMANAYESFDPDGFADAVYEFDTITKLDPWKVSLLLKVKQSIEVDTHDDLT